MNQNLGNTITQTTAGTQDLTATVSGASMSGTVGAPSVATMGTVAPTTSSASMDGAGNSYAYNAPTGTISETHAGSTIPTTIASGITAPSGIMASSAGNVYFYNSTTNTIDEIASGAATPTVSSSGATTAQTNVNQISTSQLYAACFDRVPDSGGSAFWTSAVNAGTSMNAVAQGFTASPEFNNLYPSTSATSEYITAIYNNIFNRTPDSGGLAYWSNALNSGTVTKTALLTTIINAAMNEGATSTDYQGIFAKGDFGAWCVNSNVTLTAAQSAALITGISNASTEAAAKATALSESTTAPVVHITGVTNLTADALHTVSYGVGLGITSPPHNPSVSLK